MDVTMTMLRRSGSGPKCSENFLARRINPDLATGGWTLRPGWIRPRKFGRAMSDGPDVGGGHSCDDVLLTQSFPISMGRGCCQQHILIFQAIVRSNGWSLVTHT